MASTCCCSGGPDRGYSLSPGISRPSMRTDTTPQPPYSAVSRATTGPPRRVKKVSRICPPDSAGQLNAPPGNLVRPLTTAAILATVAGSVTVKARSRRLARGAGLKPKTGVTVSTLAAGGTRSVTGRAGSQTTWASTRIELWLLDRTASTTSSRWVSTSGTAGNANTLVHHSDPDLVPTPAPAGVNPGGRWARIQASTSCGRPGTRRRMCRRRKPLPLLSILTTSIRPTWRVDATWVPAAFFGWLPTGWLRRAGGAGNRPTRRRRLSGSRRRRAVDHRPRVVAGAVFDLHRVRRRADRPGRLARGDRDLARPGQVTALYLGEVLRPGDRAVGEHPLEHLVNAVGREVVGHRGDGQAGRQLGVDPVDHRLLRHPADPEAHRLVGAIPGRRGLAGPAGA